MSSRHAWPGDVGTTRSYAALSRALSDDGANVAMFNSLTEGGAGDDQLREIVPFIAGQLLAAHRGKDVLRGVGDVGAFARRAINVIRLRETATAAAEGLEPHRAAVQAFLRDEGVGDLAKYFEALLEVGRTAEADDLAKEVVAFDSGRQTFEVLIRCALRANAVESARSLVALGLGNLSPEEQAAIRKLFPPE